MPSLTAARAVVVDVTNEDPEAWPAGAGRVFVGMSLWGWPWSDWCNPHHEVVGETASSRHYRGRGWAVRVHRHPRDAQAAVPGSVAGYAALFEGPAERWRRWTRWRRENLWRLRGRVLGCFCCDWGGDGEPEIECHAVVLARLAAALPVVDGLAVVESPSADPGVLETLLEGRRAVAYGCHPLTLAAARAGDLSLEGLPR